MAEGEDEKHEYYIRLLSFIIGPATETLQLYFEIKVLDSLDFFIFLEKHKHNLFHELYPSVPCCECKNDNKTSKKKGHLSDTQFDLLFEKDETQEIQGHKSIQGRQLKQLCLCSISAKRSTTIDVMDITLLSAVIKACCPTGSISGHPSWIKNIKSTRNFLAHCPSGKITKTEFDQRFLITEQSVLNLASVVGSTCLKLIISQISYFKKSELLTIRDIIKNNNDSVCQILELFVEEQKSTFESLASQTRNLEENTEVMKTEFFSQLREQKGNSEEALRHVGRNIVLPVSTKHEVQTQPLLNISVDIRNIVFEVKTVLQSELSKASDLPKKAVSIDDDVCYVEWRLAAPGNWNVDEIKDKLKDLSGLMGKWFRIVFVYKGSLVIQTTASIYFMQNDNEFQLAVESFLRDFVDICDLVLETKDIVKVTLVVSMETFTSKYCVSEEMPIPSLKCDICTTKNFSTDAIQYCLECQKYLCHPCIADHTLNVAFLQHNLTDIDISLEDTCSKHKGCSLEFFCEEHDCLCCKSCIDEEHLSCQNLVHLEAVAKDMNKSEIFQDFSNDLFYLNSSLSKAITTQDDNIIHLNDSEISIFNNVKSHKAVILKRLDELEGKIRLDTCSLTEEQKDKSEYSKSLLLQIKIPIQRISRQLNQVLKCSSKRELFVLNYKCKSEMEACKIKLQELLSTLKTRKIIYKPPTDIQNKVRSLGSIKLDSLKCLIPEGHVPLLDPETPLNFILDLKIEIKRPGNVCITGMAITSDNRLLLCNYCSTSLLVYDDNGTYLQDCILSGSPCDIAIIPGKDKAVVTLPDEKSIQFIDITTMIAGSIRPLSVSYLGVAVVNEKICVWGIQGLYMSLLDIEGELINTVTVPYVSLYFLNTGPRDSVYYTDFYDDTVCCITLDGEQQFKYTSNDLKGPQSVITDKKGNVYVACMNSNNIQRLTPNGEFMGVILNEENDIEYPAHMVFSYDYRKLFVINQFTDNTCLLVFSCI